VLRSNAGNVEVDRRGTATRQLYESRLHWQRKFVRRHLVHENLGGKPQNYEPDNVKTSPKRQVKVQISRSMLRGIPLFLSFYFKP